MDAKFLFWAGALLNMAAMFGLMVNGVRQIRRGNVVAHRRSMIAATSLVGVFLVAYLFKASLLGREDLSVWSAPARWNLHFHELCVLTMLLAGGFALNRARRLRATRNATHDPADPVAAPGDLRVHVRAGRVAVAAATLGLLTAGVVLAGMYARL